MLQDGVGYIVFLVFFLFVSFGLFILNAHKAARGSQYFLAGLFFSLGLSVIDVTMMINGTYQVYPSLAFWLGSLSFIYGPLILLFTRSELYVDGSFTKKDIVHFLPSVIFLLGVLLFYLPMPTFEKQKLLTQTSADQSLLFNLIATSSLILIFGYLIWSYRIYNRYSLRLQYQYSSIENRKLQWVKHVLFGFMAILFSSVMLQFFDKAIGAFDLFEPFSVISLLLLLGFIMASIFKGLKGEVVFAGISSKAAAAMEANHLDQLTSDEKKSIAEIQRHMSEHRPFLDSEITLDTLAHQLEMAPRQLSRLLNKGIGRSFFDYINLSRIDSAKQDLLAEPKTTILEIMYRNGFNSKSSFNTAFKKHTGDTPSSFRKKNL